MSTEAHLLGTLYPTLYPAVAALKLILEPLLHREKGNFLAAMQDNDANYCLQSRVPELHHRCHRRPTLQISALHEICSILHTNIVG